MSDMKHGGAAFPLQSIGVDFMPGHHGMTMRDYFAAKIIAAIVAVQDDEPLRIEEGETVREAMTRAWAGTAETAYAAADAMLAAREVRA